MTEDEMVGWHYRLNGHEFEQAQGDSEGQGSLACCSPWGRTEPDTIEQQQQGSYDHRGLGQAEAWALTSAAHILIQIRYKED